MEAMRSRRSVITLCRAALIVHGLRSVRVGRRRHVVQVYLFCICSCRGKESSHPKIGKLSPNLFNEGFSLANHRDEARWPASKKIPLDVGQTCRWFLIRSSASLRGSIRMRLAFGSGGQEGGFQAFPVAKAVSNLHVRIVGGDIGHAVSDVDIWITRRKPIEPGKYRHISQLKMETRDFR